MEVTCQNCGKSFDLEPVGSRTVYICKNCGSSISIVDEIAGKKTSVVKEDGRLTKGERFAGYIIEERIGHGGMGEVFRAKQISMNRTVALKIMKSEVDHDKEYAKRFVREARSAGRLNHPNIVQIYDVGCKDNIYYMSMEFVEGESLETTQSHAIEEGRVQDAPDDGEPIVRDTVVPEAPESDAGLENTVNEGDE